MKKTILAVAAAIAVMAARAQGGGEEHYLRIVVDNRAQVSELSQIVSVDNVRGDTVLAYANDTELQALDKSGHKYTKLPHPSSLSARAIVMATTVAEMANWDRYPTYGVYTQMMRGWAEQHPEICRLDTIGVSVQGRQLLCLKISGNAHSEEPEPEILLTSTMHGDETTGMMLLMKLADTLLANYGADPRITAMVDGVALYINPNSNPDGTYYGGDNTVASSRRSNANGVDLNRNFPNIANPASTGGNEPEIVSMKEYASAHRFNFAANFHGGAEVVNYPWDTWPSSQRVPADNDWFVATSRQYATLCQQNSPAGYMTDENNGITFGGDWYTVAGGRQDYMNWYQHCKEVCIECSSTKMIGSEQINRYWGYNQEALMQYVENAYYGVRGIVTNTDGQPLDATVTVVGHDLDHSEVVTDPAHGDYYRYLVPGTYTFLFEAYGYLPQTIEGVVVANGQTTRVDVTLQTAQVTTLAGTVVSAADGQPLAGVEVQIAGTPLSPEPTNAQGQFQVSGIMEGQYTISFTKTGFFSRTETIEVLASTPAMTIALDPFHGFSFEDGQVPDAIAMTGSQPWQVVEGEAYDGTRSLRSGTISHNQSSTATLTFTCSAASSVLFYAKVSSETNYDFLTFYLDGTSVGSMSGTAGWTEYSFPVSAGNHTLAWTYSKDGSASAGSDCAWIDLVGFPAQAPQTAIPVVTPRVVELDTDTPQAGFQVSVANIGQGALAFEATVADASAHPWLTLSGAAATVAAGQSAVIAAEADLAGQPAGTYTALINIDVVDSVIVVPVTINYDAVGIETAEGFGSRAVAIYPNPARDRFTVATAGGRATTVQIYGLAGELLATIPAQGDATTISAQQAGISAPGVYLVKISGNGAPSVTRIVIGETR